MISHKAVFVIKTIGFVGENMETRNLLNKIAGYQDAMIALQAELVKRPAMGPENGGDGETGRAEFLIGYLKKQGFAEPVVYNVPDARVSTGSRPNLAVKIPGKRRDKTLWFMAHMDVVPAGDLGMWDSEPFVMRREGDRLIGRGVEDNQQGLVSALFAMKAFIDLNVIPPLNLGLLLVADEETGSRYGIDGVVKLFPDIFGPNDEFVVPDAGAPDGTMVEVAEKGILWLRVTTKGKQCHASTPELGVNAFRAASRLVTMLDGLHQEFDEKDPVFDPPISTFEPTKKEANVDNVNTIPGMDVFYLDCRVLPGTPLDDVLTAVRRMADQVEQEVGVSIQLEEVQREDAVPPTSVDASVVQVLMEGIKQVYQVEPKAQGIGGGTVAAFLRRHGYPAVVWSRLDDLAHQPNEYCLISNMVSDAKVMTLLAARMR